MFLELTSFTEFKKLAIKAKQNNKKFVPIVGVCLSDFSTPLTAYQKLKNNQPSALLESVEKNSQGRFSIIAFDPIEKFVLKNKKILNSLPSKFNGFKDPMDKLKKILDYYSPLENTDLSFFHGGAIGYFGFESIGLLEPTVINNNTDDLDCPDIYLQFYNKIVVFDHVKQSMYLIYNINCELSTNLHRLYNKAIDQICKIKTNLESAKQSSANYHLLTKTEIKSNFTRDDFMEMVDKAKEYITKGDIFQVVLSQRFESVFPASASLDFYRLLRHNNPSPYMFHIDFRSDFILVGASPEVHTSVRKNNMLIRPIAGTRPRGKTKKEDLDLANELSNDEKEQAEHIMLIDLARNDIGACCKINSVFVKDALRVEYYSHVMHLVTDIVGELKQDITPLMTCLKSLPAGTLSGAPKIRALQIITELEPVCRGLYGGAVGWFTDYSTDSCIFIRSAVIKNGKIYWQSGTGIVHDSISENEYLETTAKAKAISKTLKMMWVKQ